MIPSSVSRRKKISSHLNELVDFVFPSFCMHCEERISSPYLFCTHCVQYLLLSEDPNKFTVFEKNPISDALINHIKKFPRKEHYKTLAAYVILRYDRLHLPFPELVVFSKNKLLKNVGKEVAGYLNLPKMRLKKYQKKYLHKQALIMTSKEETVSLRIHEKKYSWFCLH